MARFFRAVLIAAALLALTCSSQIGAAYKDPAAAEPLASRVLRGNAAAAALITAEVEEGGLDGVAPRPSPILGYVTPWNAKGYDVAKSHRCRLHYVAPVWYQLRSDAKGNPTLTGAQDVDAGWMAAVRAPCTLTGNGSSSGDGSEQHTALVLPRVIFEIQGQAVVTTLSRGAELASLLASEAQAHGFDGWVFEGWSAWAAMGVTRHPQLREAALGMLSRLAAELASAGRRLVLAVSPLRPAPGSPSQLTEADAEDLLHFADALSVMTYDYSRTSPGPMAPLAWVAENADAFAAVADRLPGKPRHNVLIGVPWYGTEYRYRGKKLVGADSVLGGRLLEVMQRQQAAASDSGSGGEGRGSKAQGRQQAQQQQCSEEEMERDQAAGGGSCLAASGGGGGGGSNGSGDAVMAEWEEEAGEHRFEWTEADQFGSSSSSSSSSSSGSSKKKATVKETQYVVFYPTPRFQADRMALAARRGMGLAVWELGQGLDSLADLL